MRKLITIIIVLVITSIIGYNYIYQNHRDIEKEIATFKITVTDLASSYSKNPNAAETKYLNNTIEVFGMISEISPNTITLEDKVFCQFTNSIEHIIKEKAQVRIKGRVIGYDDLLEQVKLDQCTINKK
ncbi:hypothetical protein A9Q86_04465 [Flavobacteriales bacterium 33_180_T64]|nr:hypothetical protein A9Q86_04465 [Flavobacteriales bacterium 33_180_T64]